MQRNRKVSLFKNMFLISTVCGALGVYFLYKEQIAVGWLFVCIWAVLAVLVRLLIILDRKKESKKNGTF
ncbi:MAG: hypothetical protein LBU55_04655 [Elusimicrobiota bacterium]|jgi:hypothetical protein|nr:hypothetical protein [Elusimicrobiota bacterium]